MPEPTAYYNDIDPHACETLRRLIAEGLIAPGDVDGRSIADIQPADLAGYTQVHLFAGLGGWSLALRLAGWPDDRPVWTASCPCQPFSVAGKQQGADDERHLWPEALRLICECRPLVAIGEQVSGAGGFEWLTGILADLESELYRVGASRLPACSVGAPHQRQRLWWVADRMADANKGERGWIADGEGCQPHRQTAGRQQSDSEPERGGAASGVADADGGGQSISPKLDGKAKQDSTNGDLRRRHAGGRRQQSSGMGNADDPRPQGRRRDAGEHADQRAAGPASEPRGMGDAASNGRREERADARRRDARSRAQGREQRSGDDSANDWGDHWIACADGRHRRIPSPVLESGLQPLVAVGTVRGRVAALRLAGNAIVPAVGALFVRAYMASQWGERVRVEVDGRREGGAS